MTAEQLVTRLEPPASDATDASGAADASTSDPIAAFGPGIALDDEVTAAVWARVQLARHRNRPRTLELVGAMADEFVELHGDRLFRDDGAIVGGFASIAGRRVMVIGHQKGAETDENIRRNFGMAHPEGYRKAMRLMELAERFRLPVVTLVDTPGASPGPGAEERGVAEAIARSIGRMLRLRTPIVTAITGEGGSGGALAIAVGDVVLALENAVYSVITPEGCASILWRAPELAPRAAVAMRMTASEQQALGVVDLVVEEPAGGAHTDHAATAAALRDTIVRQLDALVGVPLPTLLEARYQRYRLLGEYTIVSSGVMGPQERQSLGDRVRQLLDAGRQSMGAQTPGARPPGARRDEPPARDEV
jgi:acetyl-CoA carboxylase carboxyl transferase subunit alpha